MLAGHDLGELEANASNGDSPVYVKARQPSQSEWLVWSYLLGYMIQPGSGGENFWSTRFSAGNSNAQNTQGYVSVPGHGPVGNGF